MLHGRSTAAEGNSRYGPTDLHARSAVAAEFGNANALDSDDKKKIIYLPKEPQLSEFFGRCAKQSFCNDKRASRDARRGPDFLAPVRKQ